MARSGGLGERKASSVGDSSLGGERGGSGTLGKIDGGDVETGARERCVSDVRVGCGTRLEIMASEGGDLVSRVTEGEKVGRRTSSVQSGRNNDGLGELSRG